MEINIQYCENYIDLPKYKSGYAIPLYAALKDKNDSVVVDPIKMSIIRTGISLFLPFGVRGSVSTPLKNIIEYGLECIPTFIVPGDNEEIIVAIRNITNEQKIINYGTLIGQIAITELAFIRAKE